MSKGNKYHITVKDGKLDIKTITDVLAPIDFKDELNELRERLDSLFIKHFSKDIYKTKKTVLDGTTSMLSRLSAASQRECGHLTSLLGGQQATNALYGYGRKQAQSVHGWFPGGAFGSIFG